MYKKKKKRKKMLKRIVMNAYPTQVNSSSPPIGSHGGSN